MSDLDKALADIFAIRSQIAAGTAFRGYGPAAMAATGGLALLTAWLEALWLDDPSSRPLSFFAGWIITALVSGAMIMTEMLARSRRHHSGLADAMIHQAIEQFLPSAAAAVLLAAALWKFAPETLWMLPGLWQLLVSLDPFAAADGWPSRRLVLRRRVCQPDPRQREPRAVALDDGAAVCDRAMADGRYSACCIRRNRCRRMMLAPRRFPMRGSTG